MFQRVEPNPFGGPMNVQFSGIFSESNQKANALRTFVGFPEKDSPRIHGECSFINPEEITILEEKL